MLIDFKKIRYNQCFYKPLKMLPVRILMELLKNSFVFIYNRLAVNDRMRFVLELDNFIYPYIGRASVDYGNGVHSKHRHIKYHDFFVDNIYDGETILDIGCGNGELAHDIAVRSACSRITGIDQNKKSISTAVAKNSHAKIEYICADATEYVYSDNYDVVLLSNVLEHLQNRGGFLLKIRKIVRPERFLIRVPMYERDWRVPLKDELGVNYLLDPTHQLEYTTEVFAKEMAEAGMSVESAVFKWGEMWAVVS